MIRVMTKAGNAMISMVSILLAACLIFNGALNIWDMYRIEKGAFVSEELLRYRPDPGAGQVPDLEELISLNEDAVGWITISGTNIDYPVMQGETDMEYLNKDVYGEHSLTGSVFLSSVNKRDLTEPYQLIYGHHMDNGSMFGDLDKFTDMDFFYNKDGMRYSNSEGVFMIPGKIYEIRVTAVMETDAYDPMVYKAEKDEEEMEELLEYIDLNALYSRDCAGSGKILALSTCSSRSQYGRTVLFLELSSDGRMTKEQEGGRDK